MTTKKRPELVVHAGDLPTTVRAVRDLLAAKAGDLLFDRDRRLGLLIRGDSGQLYTKIAKPETIIMLAHEYCQPKQYNAKEEKWKEVTLPDAVAKMFLDLGAWNVRPLAGIATGPVIRANGDLVTGAFYDESTQFYVDTPDIEIPERVSKAQAQDALKVLRQAFYTFPFEDAQLIRRDGDNLDVVDLTKPPGLDESAFLTGLLTAVARPSLWLAPGIAVIAPQGNGSGTGKGLLLRAISIIAYGQDCAPFTCGHDRAELDKRITSELLEAQQTVFLDNANAVTLRSDTLASALTERPIKIRPLGTSKSDRINAAPFIGVTGNGLIIAEDLARRYLQVLLDPRMENPEARPFKAGFMKEITRRRTELLAACLTILRFGRQNGNELETGSPVGSYEDWSEWVRDPLLTLGCRDAIEGMTQAKARDPRRQRVQTIFDEWWKWHKHDPVKVAKLHEDVRKLIDPQGRGRQFVQASVSKLANTRQGGFVLTRCESIGRWSADTYALQATAPYSAVGVGAETAQSAVGEGADTAQSDPYAPYVSDGSSYSSREEKRENIKERGGVNHEYHRGHSETVPKTECRQHGNGAHDIRAQFADPAYRRMRRAEMSRRAAATRD